MGRDIITHSIPAYTLSKPAEQMSFELKPPQSTASLFCAWEDGVKWHQKHTLTFVESLTPGLTLFGAVLSSGGCFTNV